MFYFARCMNIMINSLAQRVKYDVNTTRKIKSIHAIFYHILLFYYDSFVTLWYYAFKDLEIATAVVSHVNKLW